MKSKNIFWLLAAVMLCIGLNAQAQSAVHPKAYYDAITYQWNDASGVSHENAITDVATNPYQIIALLKKVYCDPRLPGPTYTAYNQNGQREREVYYGAVEGGWNISASDVTAPYEEGYTILMVALNNNLTRIGTDTEQMTENHWLWGPTYKTFKSNFFTSTNELINYISNNVASVQLLVDGLRIGEGTMSGTTFNISGEYNRFFVLSKGQSRQKDSWVLQEENNYDYPIIAGERVPFKSMFEEFSPTDGSEGSQITDFYAKMINGELYPVMHDCASVIESEHEFSMSGKTGTEYKSLTGMNIFIPDYRLQYWVDDNYYIHYTNGNTEGPYSVDGRTMNPYRRINGNTFRDPQYLTAHYAQYNLEHSPQLGIYTIKLEADAEPAVAQETYTVHLDWTSSLNTMANGHVPQDYIIYIVTTDDEGNVQIEEVTTVVDDTHYDYTVPQNEHSYTITYVVYGMPNDGEHDVFVAWSNEADVIIPGWNDFLNLALDHYESDYEKNDQCNYYRNFLKIENEDVLNALTVERVHAGEDNFTLYRYDAAKPDVRIPVAELTLTVANGAVSYNVEYDNQQMLTGYNVPVTKSGVLSADNDGILDLSAILFVDQFNALTENNDHPSRYGYVMIQNSDENAKSTNRIEVPVIKSMSTIDGFYTLDEVMNDTEATLTPGVKSANVRINLLPNSHIYYYTVERGDNSLPDDMVSKLQRHTDNTFMEMNNHYGMAGNIYDASMLSIFDSDKLTGEPGDYASYQAIVWTFGDDRVKQDGENSYGTPLWTTGVGNINVNISGTRSTTIYGEFYDENGNLCNMFNPIFNLEGIVPEQASVEYEPYMYRVWRLCNDVRGYGRNPATGLAYNDPTAERSPDKLIVEEITSDNTFAIGDDDGLLNFGAKANTEISFRVRFYYKRVEASSLRSDEVPMYYVVEKIVPWSDMPTGILEFKISNEVSKTYYNAQGLESDTPFDGVNIVVTRYSDGSTTTTKVVR